MDSTVHFVDVELYFNLVSSPLASYPTEQSLSDSM